MIFAMMWQKVIKYAPYYIWDVYENSRKKTFIYTLCSLFKTMDEARRRFGLCVLWDVARRTSYYEQISSGIQHQKGQTVTVDNVIEARTFKRIRRLLLKLFPQGSRIRRALGKMYWKLFG